MIEFRLSRFRSFKRFDREPFSRLFYFLSFLSFATNTFPASQNCSATFISDLISNRFWNREYIYTFLQENPIERGFYIEVCLKIESRHSIFVGSIKIDSSIMKN